MFVPDSVGRRRQCRPIWSQRRARSASTLAAASIGRKKPSKWVAQLAPHFPTSDRALHVALAELLIFLDAPDIAAKTMTQLRAATTHEEQLDYSKLLRVLTTRWTPELRGEFFDWLGQASAWRGGGSFKLFVNRMRDDALGSAPEAERAGLEQRLIAATPAAKTSGFTLPAGRGFVKAWTLDELTALAEAAKSSGPHRARPAVVCRDRLRGLPHIRRRRRRARS